MQVEKENNQVLNIKKILDSNPPKYSFINKIFKFSKSHKELNSLHKDLRKISVSVSKLKARVSK